MDFRIKLKSGSIDFVRHAALKPGAKIPKTSNFRARSWTRSYVFFPGFWPIRSKVLDVSFHLVYI
jgi:hypothetical protein